MVILNDSAPMFKARVLYIGSAVPLETTEGLDAIQGPLRERYPVDNDSSLEGIDSILSISNACIQLQYISQSDHVIQFPISALTLCAAVRCVNTTDGTTGERVAKFVSVTDSLAGGENSKRPAIFTAITRRTQGRKVLECHGFICSNTRQAMDLVKYAKIAGLNFKKNGSVTGTTPRQAKPAASTTLSNAEQFYTVSSESAQPGNRASTISKSSAPNGTVVNGQAMRLIPAEPVAQQIAAGPEFFEPVSPQGYFYSSNNAEVRKFNIKVSKPEKKESPVAPAQNGAPLNGVETGSVNGAPTPVNGHTPSPTPRPAPSRMPGPVPPVYVRYQRPPMHPGPMFYGPPPPPMMMRPRFFSPPPPRMRPFPYAMPPGGPPPMPMYAPPIYIRRPRRDSAGSSRSNSNSSNRSQKSRGSGSKTPTRETAEINGEPREPRRRIPNADESSDESEHRRPATPPTDYNDKKKKGSRMSRRDVYEVRYGRQPSPRHHPSDDAPPFPYDYYVYPPRHGGYAPFAMYNPHGRSRSLPPEDRRRSKSPRKKKGKKKHKKNKKSRKHKERVYEPVSPGRSRKPYPYHSRYPPEQSDVSTDSNAGYHSEIPSRQQQRSSGALNGYTIYPPRDFRRDENQFMNERHFSQSIARESRKSFDFKPYQTAYELNEEMDRSLRNSRKEEPEFPLY